MGSILDWIDKGPYLLNKMSKRDFETCMHIYIYWSAYPVDLHYSIPLINGCYIILSRQRATTLEWMNECLTILHHRNGCQVPNMIYWNAMVERIKKQKSKLTTDRTSGTSKQDIKISLKSVNGCQDLIWKNINNTHTCLLRRRSIGEMLKSL